MIRGGEHRSSRRLNRGSDSRLFSFSEDVGLVQFVFCIDDVCLRNLGDHTFPARTRKNSR